MKKRLAIIHTHPIQYNVPLYRVMANDNDLEIKVFYTWSQTKNGFYDPKFKRYIKWDIPLLEGYDYEFIRNISPSPGSQKFFGIINPNLKKKIKEFNPNGIFITGWNNFSHLKTIIGFHKKIKILFRGDSILYKSNFWKDNFKKIWLKFVYSHIDYALYVGRKNKEYFLEYGLKENQLVYAPHAIENERFFDKNDFYKKQAENWKKELGISPEDITFLFVGKFEIRKNPVFLLKTFLEIKNPRYKLIFVGNGEYENQMKQMAKNDDRIKFIPFQNQSKMPVVYRLGDVLVLPSIFETWGLVVNEAMASGLAILVSDKVGCATELVKPQTNGFIFQSNNQNSLMKYLKKFEEVNLSTLKENSQKIIKDFSFTKIKDAIKKVI